MKRKLLIILACLCLSFTLIIGGCGENAQIKALRLAINNINFDNCYGYNQTIFIKNGTFEYQSYNKLVAFDGSDIKIIETTKTLNPVGESEPFTTVSTTKYISNGYLIEKVGQDFKRTGEIAFSLGVELDVKEEYFKDFTFDEKTQENSYLFNAVIKQSYYYIYVHENDVSDLKVQVDVTDKSVNSIIVKYVSNNLSNVTITTSIFQTAQQVNLPTITE